MVPYYGRVQSSIPDHQPAPQHQNRVVDVVEFGSIKDDNDNGYYSSHNVETDNGQL